MRKIGNVDPLKGPILINMIYYSLPVLAANILQMLFSTVDTMVIGRFAQGTAISSIGAVSSAISFLMNGLLSLSGGVTVVLGSLYGKKDRDGIRRIQQSLPLTSLLLGALVGAAACALTVPILKAVHCPEELMKGAATYFRLYFISAPFAITCLSISSSMQAKGESLTPVIFSLAVALLNTVLDLLFVITFGWDIFGVGLATVISQAAGTAAGLIYLSHRSDELHTDLRRLTLFDGMGEVFSIGIPYALEGMILNVSTVVISSFVNRFDPAVIAGGTIAGSVESLAVVFFTSFKSASTVFVSQNRGAGDLDRVLKTWKISLTFVFIATEAAGILIYLASPWLCRLFTEDPAVIAAARVHIFYMCMFYGLCATMNIASGCVTGLGDSRNPLIVSVICSVLFRITWLYTYARAKGTIESIYVAYPLCWFLNTALSVLVFLWDLRKLRKDQETQE